MTAHSENVGTCRNCGRSYSTDDPLLVEIDGDPKSIHKIEWRGVLIYSNLCKDCLRMTLRVIQDFRRTDPECMDSVEFKIIN